VELYLLEARSPLQILYHQLPDQAEEAPCFDYMFRLVKAHSGMIFPPGVDHKEKEETSHWFAGKPWWLGTDYRRT